MSGVDGRTALDPSVTSCPPIRRGLRNYQQQSLAAAVEGFAEHDRGQFIMACGTGKTLVAQRIAERIADGPADTVLVLFPNLALLDQNARAWQQFRERDFAALAVCSEQNIGGSKHGGSKHGGRKLGGARVELSDLSIPSTTKPIELAEWMAEHADVRRVVFATYQSSDQIAHAHEDYPDMMSPWSLIVCDEAHRTAGPNKDSLFATVLSDEKIPAAKRAFFTATPRIHQPRGRARKNCEQSEITVVSMDAEDVYGPRMFELPFKAASELTYADASGVERPVLSKYEIRVIGVDDEMIDRVIRKNHWLHELDLGAKDAANLVAIVRAAKQTRLNRIIAFHNRIEHSERFIDRLGRVAASLDDEHKPTGALRAIHLDGSTRKQDREAALAELRDTDTANGAWTVLSNVDVLTEGIDAPTLDAVAIIEPKTSQIDVIQAASRALRPHPERDEPSQIILPVYIPPGKTPEERIAKSDFSKVVRTILAMRDQDETLDSYFRGAGEPFETTLRKVTDYIDTYGHPPLDTHDPDPEAARLARTCATWAANIEHDEQADKGEPKRLTGKQTEMISGLPGFDQVEPAEITTDDDPAGGKRLTGSPLILDLPSLDDLSDVPSRLAAAIHLHLVSDMADSYETGLAHLIAYVDENGDGKVRDGHITADGFKLGQWVRNRRRDRKEGTLAPERVAELTAAGMVWDPLEDDYRDGLAHFIAYVHEHGHGRVPDKHITADGCKLGGWVRQRREGRKEGTLSPERVAELTAAGMVWDPNGGDDRDGLAHLRAYVDEHGHGRVPQSFVTADGFKLGQWVRNRQTD